MRSIVWLATSQIICFKLPSTAANTHSAPRDNIIKVITNIEIWPYACMWWQADWLAHLQQQQQQQKKLKKWKRTASNNQWNNNNAPPAISCLEHHHHNELVFWYNSQARQQNKTTTNPRTEATYSCLHQRSVLSFMRFLTLIKISRIYMVLDTAWARSAQLFV